MNTLEIKNLTSSEAWSPLPASEWNEDNAKHLLRRIGFSAPAETVKTSLNVGMDKTIQNAFASATVMPPPEGLRETIDSYRDLRLRQGSMSEMERRTERQMLQKKNRELVVDLNINWLQHAAEPNNSAFEKWGLFWENVFVVTAQKVKNPALLYQYQLMLRSHSFKDFGSLSKAVTKNPAMITFLDLQQNKKGKPNENFARELFELFMLGEGNYTENDIKEAARAFTGYRAADGEFRFISNQHDDSNKTVFGNTGNWDGDNIVELALEQPAARLFIPRELCRHYLSDDIVPDEFLKPLGDGWAANDYSLNWLAASFFSSRLFYASQFKGNKIKSPFEFMLGLLQDLNLDLPPLPRSIIPALRSMGQSYLNPPNVRGWVGGKHWINSATLIQRRQIVEGFFNAPSQNRLNGDEEKAMEKAKAEGKGHFFVTKTKGEEWVSLAPNDRLNFFEDAWLANPMESDAKRSLLTFLNKNQDQPLPATRTVAITLLQSPEYQLA